MDYFVAGCGTLITNRKPVGALIEAIGIADLFMFVRHFHPVSLRFYGPKASVSVPLWCTPFYVVFRTQQRTS
jgi:hypothetical protein